MGARAAVGDQLVPDPPRKRQVGDAIAVDVPELAPPQSELDPAEPVLRGLDARPRLDGLRNLSSCGNLCAMCHELRLGIVRDERQG